MEENIFILKSLLEEIDKTEDKLGFYEEYSRRYPNLYGQRALIAKAVCGEFVAKEDLEKAFKYIKQYIYLAFYSSIHPQTNCSYFSFRGFSDYAIQGIKESSLSLVHPRNFGV